MVDRQKAIADWHQFADLAADAPDFKFQVGQANARIQILEMLPALSRRLCNLRATFRPHRTITGRSPKPRNPEKWNSFPIKVSIGNVPYANWAQGAREAFNIWKKMFPLELTAEPEEADIRFNWDAGTT